MSQWNKKRKQEEPENCPDQPPRACYKVEKVLHRWATISLLASLAEVTQRRAKSHTPVRLNNFILHRHSCFRKVNWGGDRGPEITATGADLDIRLQNRYAVCIGVTENPLRFLMDQTSRTPKSDADSSNEADRWADREKKRRKAWLDGPSEEEKQEWLERRSRRTRYDSSSEDEDIEQGRRIAARWERDVGLAVTGLVSRMMDSRYAILGNLVREGREAEDDYLASRRRRKRVFSDDDV